MREAIEAGHKLQTRRTLAPQNCTVQPGTFEGLDLETGRARRKLGVSLRAQCTFASGRRRVVTVSPIVRPGDVFWVKTGRFGRRAASKLTLQVLRVDVSRVQDITDADAIAEGVEHVPFAKGIDRELIDPRLVFQTLWQSINGKGSWNSNPWVWVYHFRAHTMNVDEFLAQ